MSKSQQTQPSPQEKSKMYALFAIGFACLAGLTLGISGLISLLTNEPPPAGYVALAIAFALIAAVFGLGWFLNRNSRNN
jgi:divalent metal cation (Fe/Co/Zn/Cd) transporter